MLENLFGCIRSACQVAKTPTVCNLQTGYKTTMITNLNSIGSAKANCEKDYGNTLIQELTSRVSAASADKSSETFNEPDILYNSFPEIELNFIEDEALLISSTSICRKLLQTSKCTDCKNVLQSRSSPSFVLVYPAQTFVDKFKLIFRRCYLVLPVLCFEEFIKKKMLSQIEDIEIGTIGCAEHNDVLIPKLKNLTISFVIDLFCKRVNNILAKKTGLPKKPNTIEVAAYKFRIKNRGIGRYAQGNNY